MFSTWAVAPERDFLMLPPTLGRVQDADPVEVVTSCATRWPRWAGPSNRRCPGGSTPRSTATRRTSRGSPPRAGPTPVLPASRRSADPLPGRHHGAGQLDSARAGHLHRAIVPLPPRRDGSAGTEGAQGELLGPGRPFYLAEEALPRAGVEVTRGFRRARWTDGSTVVWLRPHAPNGRGPGWSGLAFNVVARNEG